jgi:hypothetical protein
VFGEGVVKDITGMKKEIGISKNENK